MSKNEQQIKYLIKEIDAIENNIKKSKSQLKILKEELKKLVDTDED